MNASENPSSRYAHGLQIESPDPFFSTLSKMPVTTASPISVFLDTSYIRKVGFRHPDFQKLIEYTKSSRLKLFVSFIAWEEP